MGYSVGGCTAQAVATRLAQIQSPAVGLILIDTYCFTEEDPDWLLSLPAAATLFLRASEPAPPRPSGRGCPPHGSRSTRTDPESAA
jgi:thioesterase domain-containing protein